MIDITQKGLELLQQGQSFVEATIVSHQGSTPRTAGAKMMITADGAGFGTVGGGILEARVMVAALEVMGTGRPQILSFDLTNTDVALMDMICGGRTEVLVDLIRPDPENLAAFQDRLVALEKMNPSLYVTVIRKNNHIIHSSAHGLISENTFAATSLPLSTGQMEEILHLGRKTHCTSIITSDDTIVLIEPIGRYKTLFLFGAGHVALFTARLAAQVGFGVEVLDDRTAFANTLRFPEAKKIHIIKDFEQAFLEIEVHTDAFLVIVTRGHLHDHTVIKNALMTDAAYIGMIGSRRKRDAIYKALLTQGFTQNDLDRVHSPIGVEIAAETPEEIAVSIVAEMIRERARMST